MRDGNWKLLINPDGTGADLHDVAQDRNVTTGLVDKEPAITKRISESAPNWQKSLP